MSGSLNKQNKNYWQQYTPGEIPSIPKNPPEVLVEQTNGPILDVGTGDGVLAETLAETGHIVHGIDIAENIIRENKNRASKVHYSAQDITTQTTFPDNYFDLVILRFTLTNIHKESWKQVGDELFRILKPTGHIWVLEPMVSTSYEARYALAHTFVDEPHCVYVFHDKDLAEKIQTKEELEKSIAEGQVSRVVKHYTLEELQSIFHQFALKNHRVISVTSQSGYNVQTFEGVFIKGD